MKKIIIIGSLVILAGFAGTFYYFNIKEIKEVNRIADDSIGISFEIDRSLERIETAELQKDNPSFLYGFRPKDVPEVNCILSQTKRPKTGAVKAEALRDGTFAQIASYYPGAKLDAWEKTDSPGREGVLLAVNYKKGDVETRQIELIATTDERTTFAYCQSPTALYGFYKKIFENYLSSIRIS